MHLQDHELVDLAEGLRLESSTPHLGSCDACRRQLADMRAMMAVVADVDVPEPSPLFWDQLSVRVRATVAAQVSRRAWLDVTRWRRVVMPAWAVAAASIIVVVAMSSQLMAPPPSGRVAATPSVPTGSSSVPPPAIGTGTSASADVPGDAVPDDASLMLVAGLTSGLDLDAAGEAGLAPAGSADHAIIQLTDAELRELHRLLEKEMAL